MRVCDAANGTRYHNSVRLHVEMTVRDFLAPQIDSTMPTPEKNLSFAQGLRFDRQECSASSNVYISSFTVSTVRFGTALLSNALFLT
jgi:hypothetical protein